jgi:hypothetical protein
MAVKVVNNGVLQQALAPVLRALHAGQTFTAALRTSSLFSGDHVILGMIHPANLPDVWQSIYSALPVRNKRRSVMRSAGWPTGCRASFMRWWQPGCSSS